MWVLVIIFLAGTSPVAFNAAGQGVTFDTMIECFQAREALQKQSAGESEYFPPGQQAVCVRTQHD
tara:strand:+ start:788 stop:982 length:195 start_codon:yes stop_codon:yes gene_type:complete